jgi:hypothetical protein
MKNATQTTIAVFGTLMGLAGIEHGVGEILQGSSAPAGIIFSSWPNSVFFRCMAGEPAMSLIPNLLITGILSILFSTAFIVCALFLAERKGSSAALILLSIVMLLSGGGIFPPVLAFFIGLLATRLNKSSAKENTYAQPSGLPRLLGTAWPWIFIIAIAAWLMLFPGVNILDYYFGVNNESLTYTIIVTALAFLALTIFSGLAHDSLRSQSRPLGNQAK